MGPGEGRRRYLHREPLSHCIISYDISKVIEIALALPCISLEQVEKKTEENKERDKEVEHLWDSFFVSFSDQPQIGTSSLFPFLLNPKFGQFLITTDATSCRTVGGTEVGRRTGYEKRD